MFGVGHLGHEAEDILHDAGMADNVGRGGPGAADDLAEAPVILLDGAAVDRLGQEFGDRGEEGQFAVQILHLARHLVRRQNADDPAVVHDGHAEKGELRPVQVPPGARPVEKVGILAEVRAGHRPARLRHRARNPFAGLVGYIHPLDIDAVRHIEPDRTRLPIHERDHPPLHPQAVAHLLEGLLELLPELLGLGQDPGDGVQRGEFFVVMDAEFLCPGRTDPRRSPI